MVVDILFVLLLILGIFFTALPSVPGMVYMFVVVFIYALLDQFETVQPIHFVIFGGLLLLSVLIDYVSGVVGARAGGANNISLLFGMIGLMVGLLLFSPFGLFLGLFLGVFLAEFVQGRRETALRAAWYALLGTFTGMMASILLAIAFVITFIVIIF